MKSVLIWAAARSTVAIAGVIWLMALIVIYLVTLIAGMDDD